MLRFDIAPVCSNAYRFQAAMSFTLAALYLFTPYLWVAFILAAGGVLRGFVSPHKCLSYRLFASLTSGQCDPGVCLSRSDNRFLRCVLGLRGAVSPACQPRLRQTAFSLRWVLRRGCRPRRRV